MISIAKKQEKEKEGITPSICKNTNYVIELSSSTVDN